jgi:hypothetical protein
VQLTLLSIADTELGRVSQRLAGVEGQVASLEERRAAAEAHLHRTQVKKSGVYEKRFVLLLSQSSECRLWVVWLEVV